MRITKQMNPNQKSDTVSNKAVDLVPLLVRSVDISTIPARPLIVFDNYYTTIALG